MFGTVGMFLLYLALLSLGRIAPVARALYRRVISLRGASRVVI